MKMSVIEMLNHILQESVCDFFLAFFDFFFVVWLFFGSISPNSHEVF